MPLTQTLTTDPAPQTGAAYLTDMLRGNRLRAADTAVVKEVAAFQAGLADAAAAANSGRAEGVQRRARDHAHDLSVHLEGIRAKNDLDRDMARAALTRAEIVATGQAELENLVHMAPAMEAAGVPLTGFVDKTSAPDPLGGESGAATYAPRPFNPRGADVVTGTARSMLTSALNTNRDASREQAILGRQEAARLLDVADETDVARAHAVAAQLQTLGYPADAAGLVGLRPGGMKRSELNKLIDNANARVGKARASLQASENSAQARIQSASILAESRMKLEGIKQKGKIDGTDLANLNKMRIASDAQLKNLAFRIKAAQDEVVTSSGAAQERAQRELAHWKDQHNDALQQRSELDRTLNKALINRDIPNPPTVGGALPLFQKATDMTLKLPRWRKYSSPNDIPGDQLEAFIKDAERTQGTLLKTTPLVPGVK